jgi:hypothetical protein
MQISMSVLMCATLKTAAFFCFIIFVIMKVSLLLQNADLGQSGRGDAPRVRYVPPHLRGKQLNGSGRDDDGGYDG